MSACALFCAVIFLFLSASAASPEDGGAEKQAGIALLTRLLEKNNELLLQKMQSMIDEALLYQPPHGRTEPQRPRRLADDAGITCASDDQQQQQGQEQQATLLLGTERGEIRFGTEADVNLYSTAPASGNGARILKTDSDFSANSVATANGADVDALATAVGANAEKVAALEALDVAARLGAVEASLANLRQSSPAPTAPSDAPTTAPSDAPTTAPSESPTTLSPTSPAPTTAPTTSRPTSSPSEAPTSPTNAPSTSPTGAPTTASPSAIPSESPTTSPTTAPSAVPSASPTRKPTASPSSPTVSPSRPPWFGDGRDGNVNLEHTIRNAKSILNDWSPAAGATEIRVNGGPLTNSVADGDMLLLYAIVGDHAQTGNWETVTVHGKSGNMLTVSPLTKSWDGGSGRIVCVIHVPQYALATVVSEGAVDSPPYNNDNPGGCGGVFVLAAQRLVIPSGEVIQMSEKGYKGTNTGSGASYVGKGCSQGSGQCGGRTCHGCECANAGGGGAIFSASPAVCPEPSAGGGGHKNNGGDGLIDSSSQCFGQGGRSYGDDNMNQIFMGSAGGAINTPTTKVFGGNGGGIIILIVGEIENNGRISVSGAHGQHTHRCFPCSTAFVSGAALTAVTPEASGGGSGGSPSIFCRALFPLERGTFHSYGIDAHACVLLCAVSTGIFIFVADSAKATTGTLEAQGGRGGIRETNECSLGRGRPTGGSGSEGRILITHSARFGGHGS